jgi:LmbE family N-acetylglucosaminyl deacetylase
MKFTNRDADLFIPDGAPEDAAMRRTTHLGIGAHQDDLEIMSWHGILECYHSETDWYMGVTVTDGQGSARSGPYASYTNEEMAAVRRAEQRKAATLGDYAGMVQLCYTSSAVKDPKNPALVAELKDILLRAKPKVVYTHNLADKHDTHVGVALRTLKAIRELPKEARPAKLLGCEVWRNLDWMQDEDKTVLDVSRHESLAVAAVSLYDSQVAGGKRYDLATIGRWRANATYYASHGVDTATLMVFAMDLTPLVQDESLNPADYVKRYMDRFTGDVVARLGKLA